MREDASERSGKYVETTSASLERLKLKNLPAMVQERQVDYVLDMIRGYLQDAKHYAQNHRPVTSLSCISYAEGLLDALKFLKLAEF